MARTEHRTTGVVDASLESSDAATTARADTPQVQVVVETRRKKKKKRRTTAGLRDADEFARRTSKASSRLARAVSKAFRTYDKETNKSSRKKRDGAIRDALENWSLGLGAGLRAASRVPNDLARAINTRTVRRQTRCVAQIFAVPFVR